LVSGILSKHPSQLWAIPDQPSFDLPSCASLSTDS
jgi:hypothetical protein